MTFLSNADQSQSKYFDLRGVWVGSCDLWIIIIKLAGEREEFNLHKRGSDSPASGSHSGQHYEEWTQSDIFCFPKFWKSSSSFRSIAVLMHMNKAAWFPCFTLSVIWGGGEEDNRLIFWSWLIFCIQKSPEKMAFIDWVANVLGYFKLL